MGEIVNLRRTRKAKARAAAAKDAAANRVKFGLSRVQHEAAQARRAAEARRLDAHKRETSEDPAESDGN